MEFLTITSPELTNTALLILRLTFGLCFVMHGLGKLGVVGPGSFSGFVSWLKSLGVPLAPFQAKLAMLSELVGGVLLALGLFTRPTAVVLAITMTVAAAIGHKGGGYLITNNPPGMEYALNLGILMIVLLLLGPGAYSLDALIVGPAL